LNVPFQPAWLDVFRLIVPEIILVAGACVLFLGATFRSERRLWTSVSLLFLAVAAVALAYTNLPESGYLPDRPNGASATNASVFVLDRLALVVKWLALVGGAVLALLSWNEVPDRQAGEYHACLLIIVAGLCLTGAANELVTLFLSLELISIPTYVLLYLPRHNRPAQEAAMKYFLLSVFSSALLLFGFSYLYGLGASTNLPRLLDAVTGAGPNSLPGIASVAVVMVIAGLGFRITAVPFHFYAPDVYQGTANAAAALLAYIPKVAGFVALARLLGYVWAGHAPAGLAFGVQVPMLLYIIAAVTMSLGNLLALLQDNVKRLLAYSSVAHAGYMLIGLTVASGLGAEGATGGVDAVLFYLAAYGAMTIGAFAVLTYLSRPERPVETIEDLTGLSQSHPGTALLMGLFLFSLIGMPLTGGFTGKLMLFLGAFLAPGPADHPWLFRILALIGVLNAAVGGWYYLRILAVMYLRSPIKPLARPQSRPVLAALWACAFVTILLGVYPAPVSNWIRSAVIPARPVEQQAVRVP
jgi:NADH-quinone oxidoreductase subunit N